MMTAENNADRMLTKTAALSFGAARRCCAFGVWLGAGLAACSYRAPDKPALHANAIKPGPSATMVTSQAIPHAQIGSAIQTPALSALPSRHRLPTGVSADAHVMPGGRDVETAAVSIDRVVGDASVTLPEWTRMDVPITAGVSVAAASGSSHAASQPGGEARARALPWEWLLAALAAIAVARAWVTRHRRRHPGTHSVAPLPAPPSRQPVEPSVDLASAVFRQEAPDAGSAAPAPVSISSLPWRYQAPAYERQEHWETLSPVDFLPVSLAAYVSHETESQREWPYGGEPVDTVLHEEIQSDSPPGSQAHSLASLFDQLEALATTEDDDVPVLLIERGSALPEVTRTSGGPVPTATLEAWERRLRQAIPNAETVTLPWLLVTVLLLRADSADHGEAESLCAEAERWIALSVAADAAQGARWEARYIDVDLCRARRQKGAARLLSLRSMPSRHAQALALGEPPVLLAWIDVLARWAECQFGDAALARYTEAEATCMRLCEFPDSADIALRRRAEILRLRATIEQGGARLKSLDTAQALLDLLYERVPNADNALAVAITALARGNVLPPEQAKEAYSHALMHAFMAESEPRLRTESLQCRLAVQWAYENLPGMPMQSDVATSLAARLEALQALHPETVQRMAQIHLRNADFARASELCEKAWRSGQATPALLATWRETCSRWATASSHPEQRMARQQAMRHLSIAGAMR